MKQNLPFLKHILDEIDFLLKETRGLTYKEFASNELLKRGCTRSIEVIGEAVKNISNELKERHKDMNGRKWPGCAIKLSIIISE